MTAAVLNRTSFIKLLVPNEAKLQNEYGETALLLAIQNKHTEAAMMLLDYEKDIRDCFSRTALITAVLNNQISLIPLLLS